LDLRHVLRNDVFQSRHKKSPEFEIACQIGQKIFTHPKPVGRKILLKTSGRTSVKLTFVSIVTLQLTGTKCELEGPSVVSLKEKVDILKMAAIKYECANCHKDCKTKTKMAAIVFSKMS